MGAIRGAVIDLDETLRPIDRMADRRIAALANRIEVRSIRNVLRHEPADLDFAQAEFAALVLDVMVAAHLRALDLLEPSYALSQGNIDRALRKAPGYVNDALRELYGSIARSIADKPMSKVREALLAQAQEVATGTRKNQRGDIRAALKKAGISFEDSPILRTVVRTQSALAFNAATWIVGQKNTDVWGFQYVTRQDERVRKAHLEFEPHHVGVRYAKEDPFWLRYAPPNGWNCRCGLRLIFFGDRDARKRPFVGTPNVPPEFQFNPGVLFRLAL